MTKERLLKDYAQRLEYYDDLRSTEEDLLKIARREGDPDAELAIRRADIRRYGDLRQLCYQVIKDLEDL